MYYTIFTLSDCDYEFKKFSYADITELMDEVKDAVSNGNSKLLKYAQIVRWKGYTGTGASNDVVPVWQLFQSRNDKPHLDNCQALPPGHSTWRDYIRQLTQVDSQGAIRIYANASGYLGVDDIGFIHLDYQYEHPAKVSPAVTNSVPALEVSPAHPFLPEQPSNDPKKVVIKGTEEANKALRANIRYCARVVANYWRNLLVSDIENEESQDAAIVKAKIRANVQIADDFTGDLVHSIEQKMYDNLAFGDYNHATLVEYKPDPTLKKACFAAGLREGEADHIFPTGCSVRVNYQKMSMSTAIKTHRELLKICDSEHPIIEFQNDRRMIE